MALGNTTSSLDRDHFVQNHQKNNTSPSITPRGSGRKPISK